ncbi:MAG: hypothetical protein WC943_17115 [Elusimicrobiota bacterium]|jgi:hypothetical protein
MTKACRALKSAAVAMAVCLAARAGAAQAGGAQEARAKDWPAGLAVIEAEAAEQVRALKRETARHQAALALEGADARIQGSFGGGRVSLAYQRQSAGMPESVTGSVGGRDVLAFFGREGESLDAYVDGKVGTFFVQENGSRFRYLGQTHRPDDITSAYVAELKMDWDKGTVEGMVDGGDVSLLVARLQGQARGVVRFVGVAQGQRVDLEVKRVPKDRNVLRVAGRMSGGPVDLALTDMSWQEFMRFFFIFLMAPPAQARL